jgi:hypothetical protein
MSDPRSIEETERPKMPLSEFAALRAERDSLLVRLGELVVERDALTTAMNIERLDHQDTERERDALRAERDQLRVDNWTPQEAGRLVARIERLEQGIREHIEVHGSLGHESLDLALSAEDPDTKDCACGEPASFVVILLDALGRARGEPIRVCGAEHALDAITESPEEPA